MFTVNGLVEFAQRYRARRARVRLARIIADLPRDVQRDIGWPTPDAVLPQKSSGHGLHIH